VDAGSKRVEYLKMNEFGQFKKRVKVVKNSFQFTVKSSSNCIEIQLRYILFFIMTELLYSLGAVLHSRIF